MKRESAKVVLCAAIDGVIAVAVAVPFAFALSGTPPELIWYSTGWLATLGGVFVFALAAGALDARARLRGIRMPKRTLLQGAIVGPAALAFNVLAVSPEPP